MWDGLKKGGEYSGENGWTVKMRLTHESIHIRTALKTLTMDIGEITK